jgi:hypothetical protein
MPHYIVSDTFVIYNMFGNKCLFWGQYCILYVWVWALKPCGTRYGKRGSWNKGKRQIHFLLCATTQITVSAYLLGFQSWDPYSTYAFNYHYYQKRLLFEASFMFYFFFVSSRDKQKHTVKQ